MKIRIMKTAIALAALLTATGSIESLASDEIRGGEWQFTTHLQLPGMSQSPGNDQGMTRTACIDSANPIPPDAHCNLDKVERTGGVVNWSMTCSAPQGPIQSAGAARYFGETMQATLTARVPGPNGQPIDAPGRITGRYLGPCAAK